MVNRISRVIELSQDLHANVTANESGKVEASETLFPSGAKSSHGTTAIRRKPSPRTFRPQRSPSRSPRLAPSFAGEAVKAHIVDFANSVVPAVTELWVRKGRTPKPSQLNEDVVAEVLASRLKFTAGHQLQVGTW